MSAGIREVTLGAYAVALLLFGLVWGARAALYGGVVTAGVLRYVYWAEATGRLDVSVGPLHPFHLVISLAVLTMVAGLIAYLVRTIEMTLAEGRAHQAALARTVVELKARNAELDAFAHTVAHDLKNPLAAIDSSGRGLPVLTGRGMPRLLSCTCKQSGV